MRALLVRRRFAPKGDRLRGTRVALAVCGVVLAHLAVETASPALTVACLASLAGVLLGPGMARGSPRAWAAALAAGCALALAAFRKWVWLPLYVPSVAGDAFAAWVFGHSLAAGRVPLIERMVRRLHATNDPVGAEISSYARRLTAAWAVLFGLLGAVSLALALCAVPNGILMLLGLTPPLTVSQTAWSWFANLGEYVLAAGFFAGEYAYRRRRFPQQPYSSFMDFARRVAAVAPSVTAPDMSVINGRVE